MRGADGRPLANAFVNVLGTDCWGLTGEAGRVELPLPAPEVSFVVHRASRESEVGGLAAVSRPFVSPRAQGVVPLPDLVGEPGGSIRGIVRNEHGDPGSGLPGMVRGPGGVRYARTGAGGVFVLGGLIAADYTVEPFAHRGAVAEAADRSLRGRPGGWLQQQQPTGHRLGVFTWNEAGASFGREL